MKTGAVEVLKTPKRSVLDPPLKIPGSAYVPGCFEENGI
jgi:hypothetical protein